MRTRFRTLTVVAVASMLIAMMGVPAAAFDYEGDQFFVGDMTIAAGDTVKGNVTIKNGTLLVYGIVEGDVLQKGKGDVEVLAGGLVMGSIDERGPGRVYLEFDEGGTVEGSIYERGRGSVEVYTNSLVKGDIVERGSGDVRVANNSVVEGSIYENSGGLVLVDAFDVPSLVKGDVYESGPGGLHIFNSTVEGSLTERGSGVVPGYVFGVVVESFSLVGGNVCESGSPAGISIFVDNTSTVVGTLGSC